jgi:hypothetical protein
LFRFASYTPPAVRAKSTLKSDAEHAVKEIEGVSAVDNQIQVLPTSPMDDQLRRAIYRAIYGDPALSRYGMSALPSIHIIEQRARDAGRRCRFGSGQQPCQHQG